MKLPRRAPREVYRVYAEEDFLAGADEGFLLGAEDGSPAGPEEDLPDGAAQAAVLDTGPVERLVPSRPRADGGAARSMAAVSDEAARRLRRAAGAAMLIGAVGAFVVLLAVNGLLTARGTRRRVMPAGLAATATRPGSPAAAVAVARTAGASHRRSPHAAVSAARSPQRGVPTSTRPRRGGESSGGRSASSRGHAVAIAAAAPPTVARLAASAEAGLQPTDDPEFGFER